MSLLYITLRRTAPLLVAAALAFAGPATAQSAADSYYRAYYLEHEQGDAQAALKLYREIAGSRSATPELVRDAQLATRRLEEDLAASDLAALVPPETIVYAEINRPGDQLSTLLDQLGILGEKGVVLADRFSVSPHLLEGVLGLRGAAIAVTALDGSGEPKRGVAILHPGRHDIVRGLVDTMLPAAGKAIEPIRGRPAWNIDGEVIVALSARLVVLGTDRNSVEGVFARLDGEVHSSLAQSTPMRETLGGPTSLLGLYVQAEPIRPMLRMLAEQAIKEDPQAATAFQLFDIESLESLSGRIAIEDDGLQLDLSLQLAEGHKNLAFNLLRLPSVQRKTLALVPDGAAFFLAAALNRHAPVVPGVAQEGEEPIVTLMDFGREVFANVVDVTVFGLPPAEGDAGGPLPAVACFVRANDVARSKALWTFALGLASQSGGGASMQPAQEQIAGLAAERYTIQGMPLYLVEVDHGLLISPSRSAVERSLAAHASGRSALDDEAFSECLGALTGSDTLVLVANPGRCARMALPMAPAGEATELQQVARLLDKTVLSIGIEHSQNRLSFRARLRDVPDISRFVLQAAGGGGKSRHLAGAR